MKTIYDVLRHPLVIGAFVLSILIVVGAYFGFHWYYGEVEPVPEELLNYKPEPTVSHGAPEGKLSWANDSATQRQSPTRSSEGEGDTSDETGDLDDLAYTPVHYFPDGTPVPEHLLCPEKWVGVYITSLDKTVYAEVEQHIHAVAREIVANHNPNRPLAEVWPSFIEAEHQLRAESEDGAKIQNVGSNRIDGMYEQMRKYPEVFELIQEEGPSGLWARVYEVEMGNFEPNWNVVNLPDGRDFRTKYGYRYRFSNGSGAYFEFCQSDSSTAELVVIDNYEQLSDAELERLGGWNYNYNPYINQ